MDVPTAGLVFGTLGALCWSVQLIPQIVINYRRHHALGLQPTMMMLWAWAGIPLGVYNIVSGFNIALQIQPQILSFLSLVTWIQCYYYERKWPIAKALAVVVPIACFMAGVELGLIFALRVGLERDIHWPLTLMAVLAASLLALGVLRHYWDIYIHRTVRGISFLFVGIDAMGDLTSLLALLFNSHLDVLGLVIYGVELALWIGVFACGGYFNLVPWVRRKVKDHRTANVITREEVHLEDFVPELTIHSLPSSTSVFRTPSRELRPRNADPIIVNDNHTISLSNHM